MRVTWWKSQSSKQIEDIGKLWQSSVNAMLGTQPDPVEQQPRELPLFYGISIGLDFVCIDCSEGYHCEYGVTILNLENEKVRCGCECVVEVVARRPPNRTAFSVVENAVEKVLPGMWKPSKRNVPRGTWKPTSTARQDPFWKR